MPKTDAVDYLRTVAISRIVLDNVPNLQASWVTMGMKIGQLALRFGGHAEPCVRRAGGAEVRCCAPNPLSTQAHVASALVKEYGIPTYAIHNEDRDTYYSHLRAVLERRAALVERLYGDAPEVIKT